MGGHDRNSAERARAWRAAHPDRVRAVIAAWQPRGSHLNTGPALTPLDVRAIRAALAAGVRRKAIALVYHVAYNTIRRIDVGETYNGAQYFDD